jgi:hypothetical protein
VREYGCFFPHAEYGSTENNKNINNNKTARELSGHVNLRFCSTSFDRVRRLIWISAGKGKRRQQCENEEEEGEGARVLGVNDSCVSNFISNMSSC